MLISVSPKNWVTSGIILHSLISLHQKGFPLDGKRLSCFLVAQRCPSLHSPGYRVGALFVSSGFLSASVGNLCDCGWLIDHTTVSIRTTLFGDLPAPGWVESYWNERVPTGIGVANYSLWRRSFLTAAFGPCLNREGQNSCAIIKANFTSVKISGRT